MSTVLNISAACEVSVFWSRARPKSSHCPKPEDRVAPFQITFYSADIVAFFPLCPVNRPPPDIFLFSRYGRIFCQYRRGGSCSSSLHSFLPPDAGATFLFSYAAFRVTLYYFVDGQSCGRFLPAVRGFF